VDHCGRGRHRPITCRHFPGTSRSGATIILALILGLNRVTATEFSFLVGIPTMLAAGGLKIFKAVHHPLPDAPHENWGMLLLATVIAAVVSFIAVKWLLRFVQTIRSLRLDGIGSPWPA